MEDTNKLATIFPTGLPDNYYALKTDGSWVELGDLQLDDEVYVVTHDFGVLKKEKIETISNAVAHGKLYHFEDEEGFSFNTTPEQKILYYDNYRKSYYFETPEPLIKRFDGSAIIPITKFFSVDYFSPLSDCYDIPDTALELLVIMLVCEAYIDTPDQHFVRCKRQSYCADRVKEICQLLDIDYDVTEEVTDELVFEFNNVHPIIKQLNQMLNECLLSSMRSDVLQGKLAPRQARILLQTWVLLAGHFHDTFCEIETFVFHTKVLAYLAILAGYSARIVSMSDTTTLTPLNCKIRIYKKCFRTCKISTIDANDIPTVGIHTPSKTLLCMSNTGNIFVAGNPMD